MHSLMFFLFFSLFGGRADLVVVDVQIAHITQEMNNVTKTKDDVSKSVKTLSPLFSKNSSRY